MVWASAACGASGGEQPDVWVAQAGSGEHIARRAAGQPLIISTPSSSSG